MHFEMGSPCLLFQFREAVAEKFKAEIEQVCLIFAGKILKDPDTLKSQSMMIFAFSSSYHPVDIRNASLQKYIVVPSLSCAVVLLDIYLHVLKFI